MCVCDCPGSDGTFSWPLLSRRRREKQRQRGTGSGDALGAPMPVNQELLRCDAYHPREVNQIPNYMYF
jgi:hypothetical protein